MVSFMSIQFAETMMVVIEHASRQEQSQARSVSSFSPNRFTSEMAEFLAELAPSVSIAVSNARTFAQLEANREELKNETLSLRTELREIHNFEEFSSKIIDF